MERAAILARIAAVLGEPHLDLVASHPADLWGASSRDSTWNPSTR